MGAAPTSLPTFFVIGAPKCGTTSLHHMLASHPHVSMSSIKEPFVFAGEDWRAHLADYAELLDATARARGESSTVYSQHPHFPDVPERISAVLPRARFVYLVRDPIDRAIAHYRQRTADGAERRGLNEAFADYREPGSAYLAASRYATQLRRYLGVFEREQILVLDMEGLRDRPGATLTRIWDFVGVRPEAAPAPKPVEMNTARQLRVPTRLGGTALGAKAAGLAKRAPLPQAVRERGRALVSRPVVAEALEATLRVELADSLRSEAEWLREFTGERYTDWSL